MGKMRAGAFLVMIAPHIAALFRLTSKVVMEAQHSTRRRLQFVLLLGLAGPTLTTHQLLNLQPCWRVMEGCTAFFIAKSSSFSLRQGNIAYRQVGVGVVEALLWTCTFPLPRSEHFLSYRRRSHPFTPTRYQPTCVFLLAGWLVLFCLSCRFSRDLGISSSVCLLF